VRNAYGFLGKSNHSNVLAGREGSAFAPGKNTFGADFSPVMQFKNVTFAGIILQSVMLPVVVVFPFFLSLVFSWLLSLFLPFLRAPRLGSFLSLQIS